MLFSYSPVGYQDNWLHDTLIAMLAEDFRRIDDQLSRLKWPNCIPIARRESLKDRRGLRDRRVTLLKAYKALAIDDRDRVRLAMNRHNDLPGIFEDGQPGNNLGDLPEVALHAIKSFFEFAFEILRDIGLRDENYKRLYEELDSKVCAFCGIEILDAPGQKREALDHYLPIKTYFFAGTNFRNLSPMGSKCNSRYKGQQDILTDPASGVRRVCCDPYDSPSLSLSLNESRPFEGKRVDLVTCPDWAIQWNGGSADKLRTWESVFAISDRYRESSLNPNFRSWIDHFCQWSARQAGIANSPALVRDLLCDFAEIVVPEGWSESAFLKRATFQMLAGHCNDTEGGLRVFEWLNGQIAEHRVLSE